MWENEGFSEGASVLKKIAAPTDVADQIQDALNKKEEPTTEETPVEGLPAPEAPMEEIPLDMPLEGASGDLPPAEAPPLPVGVPAPPAAPEAPIPPPMSTVQGPSDNPYVGKTIQDVVDILEPAAQQLSERKDVRELTKADMMLDALNVASHFPELGEAIAKMIESTIYVHTRLEKVISKLKGGLREEQEETAAPVVEMEELGAPAAPPAEAPMAPPNEKEMFEVTEEEPTK
jgi:hypothetical protein